MKDVLHNGNFYLALLHPATTSRFWTKIGAFVSMGPVPTKLRVILSNMSYRLQSRDRPYELILKTLSDNSLNLISRPDFQQELSKGGVLSEKLRLGDGTKRLLLII